MQRNMQFQIAMPTPVVKKLIIINLFIWIFFQLILESMFFSTLWFTQTFGMIPMLVFEKFYIWQVFTYLFLHGLGPMHVLFNMIGLWFFGTELETRWGGKLFLTYYLFTGVGAALIYLFGVVAVAIFKGAAPLAYTQTVVGASGSVFGILLAYGVLFGDRTIYFFGAFPILAKYFVAIIGAIEVLSLLGSGLTSGVANLAHIGGLLSGLVFLFGWTKLQQLRWRKSGAKRNLKLVVNREEPKEPRFWN